MKTILMLGLILALILSGCVPKEEAPAAEQKTEIDSDISEIDQELSDLDLSELDEIDQDLVELENMI
jgi:PBP1b-binding outer membrane lipoprotein LpoB